MGGSWRSTEIGAKAADVFEPSGPVRFGILHLHDVDGITLRHRPAYTRWLDEWGWACICPQGGPCWWLDRPCPDFDNAVTPERHLLDLVLPSFAHTWGLAPRAVAVQGIGMGGQGALRLAFKHPERLGVVAAVAPSLDYQELYGQGSVLDLVYDSKEQCRQDTALMHLPPNGAPPHIFFCCDPDDRVWYRGNDRLHEKMTALGVSHEADLTTRAGGHSWAYFDHMGERAERFVKAGLERESMRLL